MAGWKKPETFPHLQCKRMKLYHVLFICSLHQGNTRVKDWTHYNHRKHLFTQMKMRMIFSKVKKNGLFSSLWKRISHDLMVLWERVLCLWESNKAEWESRRFKSNLGMICRCWLRCRHAWKNIQPLLINLLPSKTYIKLKTEQKFCICLVKSKVTRNSPVFSPFWNQVKIALVRGVSMFCKFISYPVGSN